MVLFVGDEPLVDDNNPLYCPEVSAQQFISSVRLFQASVSDSSRFTFYQRLCSAFVDNSFKESPTTLSFSFDTVRSSRSPVSLHAFNTFVDENRPPSRSAIPELRHSFGGDTTLASSDDQLLRPSKRVKRSSSQDNLSFIISSKPNRLSFADMAKESTAPSEEAGPILPSDVTAELDEDDLLYALSGPENGAIIDTLLIHLEKILPGIKLRDKFDPKETTYQDIVNHLGLKGRLSFQTLSLFRNTNTHAINLSESMTGVPGLNLDGRDTLKAFKLSNSFVDLRSLTLSDVTLIDDDIEYISNLFLESLFLDDTQIGDEAVMRLISLKQTLSHLELSWNKRITDDSVPTLCALSTLNFLSLKQTSISMKGMRKLACAFKAKTKKISIILPSVCEEYMLNLHKEYAMTLDEPLVCDPTACSALDEVELKANLAVHAAVNSEIETSGTRIEVEKRLRKVLERRQKDIVVQEYMLEGFA